MTLLRKLAPMALSIRGALLGVVAVLSLLAAAMAGLHALNAWSVLRQAEEAQAEDRAANRFAAGLHDLLLERLFTGTALQAPGPMPAEARQRMEQHRAGNRAALRAEGLPAAASLPGGAALLENFRTALRDADAVRQQADLALGLPRDQRQAAAIQPFVPTMSRLLEASTRLWAAYAHDAAGEDAVLTRLATLKEIGWRMREAAGFELGLVGVSISGERPLEQGQLTQIAAMRSRIDALWSQVENLAPASDPATHPALRAAFETIRQQYFEGFRRRVDEAVRRGAEAPGGRYGMTGREWIEGANPMVGTLLLVRDAAGTASEAHMEALVDAKRAALAFSAGAALLVLLVAVGAVWIVLRRVTAPLAGLAAATERLGAGELETPIPGMDRGDEVGAVARALGSLRDGSRRARELEAAAAADRAAREARHQAIERETGGFGDAAAGIMARLGDSATALRQAADAMASGVASAGQAAATTAEGAERNAANLASVAAATEELTASIGEISRQVASAAGMAREADERARSTNATVLSLAEAAAQIGDVVRLIGEIAGQTNLLALNATIEAARAGDAGKGFAVVASEVKTLAGQTAKATEQISAQIGAIQSATDLAVSAIKEVGGSIARVSEVATAIAAAVEEQGSATREIAGSVQVVAQQNEEATRMMQQVQAAVRSSEAQAQAVQATGDGVSAASDELRGRVDRFLAAVRAA
ncbi:methyl-accepting chemotaxis protein [Falsiroseomonas ponticola]|uniref:methyl-accepting chemotaxis protein n=1 Tax=Falsiroseomonas ponticola TaxID=2786951 RepID=UPI001932A570|nr:HAMP domain-containing methyl-accepting chemotaxis protein [Roseomonas ponticola]